MSRGKPGACECERGGRNTRAHASVRRGRRHSMRSLEKTDAFRAFGLLCVSVLACWDVGASRAQTPRDVPSSQDQLSDAEKANYAEALAYCRWNVPRPIALRDDNRVLCFDGTIDSPIDPSIVNRLAQGGLFVVRNAGGDARATIRLADTLRRKQATVIINEYCLANCANYLFLASLTTFVPKDALVAWSYAGKRGECAATSPTREHGAPRFDIAPRFNSGSCPGDFDERRNGAIDQLKRKFYEGRAFSFEMPPQSVAVQRMLKGRFDATGALPPLYWTWNPRFYASAITTKVFYESYPRSQDEVDALAARIGLRARLVIYDP